MISPSLSFERIKKPKTGLIALFISLLIILSGSAIISSCGGSDGGGAGAGPVGEPREVVVDPEGNGDYRNIQRAVNDTVPGSVVLVRNGTYNDNVVVRTSGTAELPITIKNYPDEHPVVIPGLDIAHRFEINAEHIIVEGFEIRGGYDGVKIYKSNNIVRNNYVHHNKFGGIMIAVTTREISNLLIENNLVDSNGYRPETGDVYPGISPKNTHGIYVSDFSCLGTNDIIIRNNEIRNHGGRAIQWNGENCDSKMRGTLVEGNLIENNSWGLALFFNVEGALITNNVFRLDSRPETNDTIWTFFGIWGSRNNVITENEFHSILPDVAAIAVVDGESTNNTVDDNVWRTAGDLWIWDGEERTDWEDYPEVTGWDENGDFCTGCE